MIPLPFLLFASVLLPSSVRAGAGGRRDVLVTGEGKRISVDEILADAAPEVRYRVGESQKTIPASQVARIEYADEPPALRLAREKRAAGNPDAAFRALAAAKEARGVRPWLKEAVAFETAEVLEEWGAIDPARTEEAAEAYRAYAGAYPSSRREVPAILGRARCLRATKQFDAALALFVEVERKSLALGEEAELEASYEKATTLLAAGRTAEARGALKALEGRIAALPPGTHPRLLARARTAQGDCLLAEGNAAAALVHFRRLLAEAGGDFGLRAAARAGEGEALLASGKVREAMFAFAEVRATEPAGLSATPRATYLLAECYRRLAGREPDADRKAKSYFLEVLKTHPSSPWAGRARAALGG